MSVRHRLLAGLPLMAPSLNLTKARDQSVTFKVQGGHELGFTMDGASTQALGVTELQTDVHLVRDGVTLYTGRVGRVSDTIGSTGHQRTYQTADAKALLARRLTRTEPSKAYAGVEQFQIVKELIDTTQALPGGSLGIDTTLTPSGVLATRTVNAGAVVADEVNALAGAGDTKSGQPGFDWDISAGWTGRKLQLFAPQRGNDRGVVLDYIAGRSPRGALVESLSRDLDPTTFANSIRVSGGSKTTTQAFTATNTSTGQTQIFTNQVTTNVSPQYLDATTVGTAPQGRWETSLAYPDTVETADLTATSNQQLAALSVVLPTYSVGLRVNRWQGPDHIWIGDLVRVRVNSGPLQEDLKLRVQSLTLVWNDDGDERVALTLGVAAQNVTDFLSSAANRLSILERRSS